MDLDQAKLFVGGISWETNEGILKDHFCKYGDVVSTVIMRDRNTGSTRGFGFVSFAEPSEADKALQEKHDILGRMVEVKRAVPRSEQQLHQQNKGSSKNHNTNNNSTKNFANNQLKTKKIFVGGLSPSVTEDEFKGYFEKFGKITDVVVMYDGVTRRPRGFGFITFDSEEAVESVMQKNFHELNDKLVEVKKAIPKDGGNGNYASVNNNGHGMRMAGGGRGSVFGCYNGGNSPAYGPKYGFYQCYGAPPPAGYGNVGAYPYGGGYPMGVYSGVAYGAPPFTPPRSPWNGAGVVGAFRGPAPHCSAAVYPGYVNCGYGVDGYMGMVPGGYRGMMGPTISGKWNQGGRDIQAPVGGTPGSTQSQDESV